ncbi:MAG: hypothetical protein H7Z71_00435 [Moraxellaceae bacterium]|nr:hypothetical protein [Pseudobdellovibrionaceae bacterium]
MNKSFLTVIGFGLLALSLSARAEQKDPRSVVTSPRPVQEVAEFRPHLGLIVGVSRPEGSGQESSDLGIDFGYQAYIPFSLGAEYFRSRVDDGKAIKDRNTVWLKSTYNFGGTIPVLNHGYAGLALGAVFNSDKTSAAIAPVIGFDIPVTDMERGFLSLGATARYAIISDGELDTFSLGGVVKYWF